MRPVEVPPSQLADHTHEVRWQISPYEKKPEGRFVYVDLQLDCGCEIGDDLEMFAAQMRAQKGWRIATTAGWGSSRGGGDAQETYRIRMLRSRLEPTGRS